MLIALHQKKLSSFIRSSAAMILLCFLGTTIIPTSFAQEIFLPAPGSMVGLSSVYAPAQLLGLRTYKENPFRFDFILDTGETPLSLREVNAESEQLIKYFLTALTVPEKDLWVNLSPHEKNRIIPDELSQTAMGKELLLQDYFLKQLSSSLSFPESELGQQFWARVSAEAKEQYGASDIPMDTFNRIWIVPDKAVVYENADVVFVGESHLKVMLEEDFKVANVQSPTTSVVPSVMREMIIPKIEQEVNTGKSFAKLRQMYGAMILATWYKQALKDGLLGRSYVDGKKMAGVDIPDENIKEKVYAQYLEAFKQGAYSIIKEEADPLSGDMIPRKYFSGGFQGKVSNVLESKASSAIAASHGIHKALAVGMAVLIGVVLIQPPKAQIIPAIETRPEILTQDLNIPGVPKYNSVEEQQLAERRERWLSLANENFVEVFERAQEFIHEPFAYEVLEKAAFAEPIGPFITSVQNAFKYIDNYITHPRAWELLDTIARLYGAQGYYHAMSYMDKPYTGKVLDLLLKYHPAALSYILQEKTYVLGANPAVSKGLIVKILKQRNDPVTKKVLEVFDSKYDWETKEKMIALLDSLVRGELSLQAAVDVINDDAKFAEALVTILARKDHLAGGAIDYAFLNLSEAFNSKGNKQLESGQLKKTLKNMPVTNVIYLMAYGGLNSQRGNDSLNHFLLDWLIPQIQGNSQILKDFVENENATGRALRSFFRLAAEFDRLEEILPSLDSAAGDAVLRNFILGRKQDTEMSSRGTRYNISNLIAITILSSDLLQRLDTTSQNAEFYQQALKQAKQDIVALNTSHFLIISSRYLKGGFVSELIDTKISEAAQIQPESQFFYFAREILSRPNGPKYFTVAAKNNPEGAVTRIASLKKDDDLGVRKILQNIIDSDPAIKILSDIATEQYDVNLNKNTEIRNRVVLLLDRLATGEMTVAQARDLVRDPFALVRELARIQAKPDHFGEYAITSYLSDYYLRIVQEINRLHEQPDAIRFKSIEQGRAQDLYMLMVEGEQEIYTSSFNGIFNRLLDRMKQEQLSGQQLLQQSDYNRFRSFVRLLTGFGRLNDFLATMDEAGQKELINKFTRGIEKEKNFLEQAVVVAETFGMVTDKQLLAILQKTVHEEYNRVVGEKHEQGMVLYGLLSGFFGQEALVDESWFKEMAVKYPLAKVSEVASNLLFNARGQNIQQHFFYNDGDGKQSFDNFISTYKADNKWKVFFEENYVRIVGSEFGKQVIILANKPDKETPGQEDIAAYLSAQGMQRQMVVHRGHSYHVDKTIEQLQSTDIIVSLGSCGGFNNVAKVLDRAPQANILSTKGTGTMYVNDPLLKLLNNTMLKGDIAWVEFWADAERRISSTYFNMYVAPHKNLGALFIKAFNAMTKPAGEQTQEVSLNNLDDDLGNQEMGRSVLDGAAASYVRLANAATATDQDVRSEFFELYALMTTWSGRFDLIAFFNDHGQEKALPPVSQVMSTIAQHGMLREYNAAVDGSLARGLAQGVVGQTAASSSLDGQSTTNPGGIDLDAGKLNLEIKRNASPDLGSKLFEFENFVLIEGLAPMIINVTPITNLPMILGLSGDDRVESSLNLVSQK